MRAATPSIDNNRLTIRKAVTTYVAYLTPPSATAVTIYYLGPPYEVAGYIGLLTGSITTLMCCMVVKGMNGCRNTATYPRVYPTTSDRDSDSDSDDDVGTAHMNETCYKIRDQRLSANEKITLLSKTNDEQLVFVKQVINLMNPKQKGQLTGVTAGQDNDSLHFKGISKFFSRKDASRLRCSGRSSGTLEVKDIKITIYSGTIPDQNPRNVPPSLSELIGN